MFGLNEKELKTLLRLNTPHKIQDFLENLEINFEKEGDTCMSPRKVLQTGKAHCIEAAIFAALALRVNGYPPLLVDLTANNNDYDHVITVFKKNGHWGAISKTNRAILRYRDPIYKSIRELVMSYFNEYFLEDGKKTLRSYSSPVDISKLDKFNWITSEENIWIIPEKLIETKHFPIVSRGQVRGLRASDPIEIESARISQWKPVKNNAIKLKYKRSKNAKAFV